MPCRSRPQGISQVGNLDTVFGKTLWPLVDLILPLASIAVFFLDGKLNGKGKLLPGKVSLFLAFLVALGLIISDDFCAAVGHPVTLPDAYWVVAR